MEKERDNEIQNMYLSPNFFFLNLVLFRIKVFCSTEQTFDDLEYFVEAVSALKMGFSTFSHTEKSLGR